MKRLSIPTAAILALALVLAACGKAAPLVPAVGEALPVTPYGARTQPSVDTLLTPEPQARPDRSDELLKRSEERRSDDFDLPPE